MNYLKPKNFLNFMYRMKLSGAIGMSLLKFGDKEYYIFYDQHNNTNYCDPIELYIDSFIKNIINKNTLVLLEEILDYGDDGEIITLWPSTPHTVRFKKFFLEYKNYNNVIPFDIRTILLPCSLYFVKKIFDQKDLNFENLDLNKLEKNLKQVTVREYFYPLLYFLDIIEKDEYLHKKYDKIISNIKTIKKEIISCFKKIGSKDKQQCNKIYSHYKKIKSRTQDFYDSYLEKFLNYKLLEFYNLNDNSSIINSQIHKNFLEDSNFNNYSWIDTVDLILDSLMEFYGILIILCRNKDQTFLHSGLAHSSNIVWLLRNFYDFESVKDIGFTENNMHINHKINDIPIVSNCLAI
ncbi:hypothetical protein CPAV1605_1328 [seawater metagenome]|uniref:Uncharacterized protein n=1 Tax=seawater metagenome TaxID=1561972 RepID=A0A5E8CK61_9ZZZZ